MAGIDRRDRRGNANVKHCGSQHHFIGKCNFHLTTLTDNGYVVSTVGEYPDALKGGKEFQPLGIASDDLYETMVFHAAPCSPSHACGIDADVGRGEQQTVRYSTPRAANEGHFAAVERWSANPQSTAEAVDS